MRNAVTLAPPKKTIRAEVRKELSKRTSKNGMFFEWASENIPWWHNWAQADALVCGENPLLISLMSAKLVGKNKSIAIHCGNGDDPFWDYTMFQKDPKTTKRIFEIMKIGESIEDVIHFSARTIIETPRENQSVLCDRRLSILAITPIDGKNVVTMGEQQGETERKTGTLSKLKRMFDKEFSTKFQTVSSKHGYLHILCNEIHVCGGVPTWTTLCKTEEKDKTVFQGKTGVFLHGTAAARARNLKTMHEITFSDIMQSYPFNNEENENVSCHTCSTT